MEHKGDKALLKGTNPNGFTSGDWSYTQFVMTGSIAASGSVMSLVDGVGTSVVIPSNYCFRSLFFDCSSLTQAPELPATQLMEYCYDYMFSNCTNLVNAPKLPALTVVTRCYSNMFNGCSSLKNAPELPATGMTYWDSSCYSDMFKKCTSLTVAPALPSLTLGWSCYSGMFSGCTSLVKAPALPSTSLKEYCYQNMFSGCTSLTEAPELPATTLSESCYKGMFSGCTNLKKAPVLPATALGLWCCYNDMFSDCEKLSEVTVSFTDWGKRTSKSGGPYIWDTEDWLSNVAPVGKFICPEELPEEFGPNRIPEGWEIIRLAGVDDITADNSWRVCTSGLTLIVLGAKTTIEVYDITGKLVTKETCCKEETQMIMPHKGVYIVKVGSRSVKVEL